MLQKTLIAMMCSLSLVAVVVAVDHLHLVVQMVDR